MDQDASKTTGFGRVQRERCERRRQAEIEGRVNVTNWERVGWRKSRVEAKESREGGLGRKKDGEIGEMDE